MVANSLLKHAILVSGTARRRDIYRQRRRREGGHPPTSAFSEIKVRYSDIAVFFCLERIGWKLVGGYKYSCLVAYSAVPAAAASPARSVVGSLTPPKPG